MKGRFTSLTAVALFAALAFPTPARGQAGDTEAPVGGSTPAEARDADAQHDAARGDAEAQHDAAQAPSGEDAPPPGADTSVSAGDLAGRVAAHDERAARLFARGDYGGALAEQRAAQALSPAAPRVFNMAVCEERLGHPEAALELYEEFIETPDVPPERREAARRRAARLRERIAEDMAAARRLAAEAAAAASAERQAAAASSSQEREGLSPAAFWVLVGITAAATVATVVLGAVTLDLHDEFLSLYRGEDNSDELAERGGNLSLATNIMLAFTAFSALTTLVFGLDVDWSSRRRRRERASVAPLVSRAVVGLGVGGRF